METAKSVSDFRRPASWKCLRIWSRTAISFGFGGEWHGHLAHGFQGGMGILPMVFGSRAGRPCHFRCAPPEPIAHAGLDHGAGLRFFGGVGQSPFGAVAQWIEHRSSKPRVAGSTPARPASLRSSSCGSARPVAQHWTQPLRRVYRRPRTSSSPPSATRYQPNALNVCVCTKRSNHFTAANETIAETTRPSATIDQCSGCAAAAG